MLLEVSNIDTYYGTSHVLQGVSLSVDEGEVVALLGRNGVGKTTTLRSIIGLTPPKRGTDYVSGKRGFRPTGVPDCPPGRGLYAR